MLFDLLTSIASLQNLPYYAKVVRTMPNTPVIVLHGVTVYSVGQNVNEEDREMVDDLLTSVGVGMEIQEHYMDIMTGLTGGGPSFVSHMCCSGHCGCCGCVSYKSSLLQTFSFVTNGLVQALGSCQGKYGTEKAI